MKERKKLSFRWPCHPDNDGKAHRFVFSAVEVMPEMVDYFYVVPPQRLHICGMANGADPGLGNDSRMPLAASARMLYNDALCLLRTVKPFFSPPSLSFKYAGAWKKKIIFTSAVVNRLYISRICCDVCLWAPTRLLPQIKSLTHTFCNNVLQLSRSIMHSFSDVATKRSVISLTENDSLISEMYSVLVAKWGCLHSSPCRSGKLHTLLLWDRAL